MIRREYYPSNIVGTTIVNAVTGKPYDNWYVGSLSENNLFRVIDSTGNCNKEGFRYSYRRCSKTSYK